MSAAMAVAEGRDRALQALALAERRGRALQALGGTFAELALLGKRRAPEPMTLERLLALPGAEWPVLAVADGVGVDSTAMLIGLQRLGIVPDVVLHADTGDEHPETVAYRQIRRAWLRSVGFPDLTMVQRVPSRPGKFGLSYRTLGENCVVNRTLPSLAFGRKACSSKWKIAPQNKWMKQWAPALDAWRHGQKVVKFIGYDAGKQDSRRAHRLRSDDKYDYIYPLREWGWDRERAIAEIIAAGVPVPRKSACIYCPASKPHEIAELVRDHPDLADYIVQIEETAQPHLRKIEGLWRKGTRARPGSMAQFIRVLRADPANLARALQGLPLAGGDDAPPASTRRKRLPLVRQATCEGEVCRL
jgi:hypothetical protein